MTQTKKQPPPPAKKPKPISPDLKPKKPEIYYNSIGKDYYKQDDRGIFRSYNERAIRRALVGMGFSDQSLKIKDQVPPPTEIDDMLCEVEQTRCPSYIGPLAGHQAGAVETNGKLILITESTKLIEPAPGDWTITRQLIEQQFKSAELDQTPYLYGWMKFALECFHSGKHFPGQALVMVGPAKCGKSIIQDEIFTPLFGGRMEKPMRYLRGDSTFNSELFAAGHLKLEDELGSPDPRARRQLGNGLKQIASNRTHSCHGKNREALSLAPCWRCSVSVNNETEEMMSLPIIAGSLTDKITLLLAAKFPMPMPTETAEQKAIFAARLRQELPALSHFLLNWNIPAHLRSPDYGVREFHHSVIMQALQEFSPESQLWDLIQDHKLDSEAVWEGTSNELQEELICISPTICRGLFTWATACGTYLGRLEKLYPKLVSSRIVEHGSKKLFLIARTENDATEARARIKAAAAAARHKPRTKLPKPPR